MPVTKKPQVSRIQPSNYCRILYPKWIQYQGYSLMKLMKCELMKLITTVNGLCRWFLRSFRNYEKKIVILYPVKNEPQLIILGSKKSATMSLFIFCIKKLKVSAHFKVTEVV